MLAVLLLCVVLGLLTLIFKQWFLIRNHWKEKGLPQVTPYPLLGNMLNPVVNKKTMGETLKDLCNKFSEDPIIGMYNFTKAALLINDPEYAETVLIKEFASFMDRNAEFHMEERRPLDKHLFFITGAQWKGIRSKMSPVFTTGKLKAMLPEIEKIFEKTLENIGRTESIDLKDLLEVCTLRVRASCVFGLDLTDSQMEKEFIENVKHISKNDFFTALRTTIALWFPKLAKRFNFAIFGTQIENYFIRVLLDSFKKRSESKIVKHDFVQTLFELRSTGKIEVKEWAEEDDFLKAHEHHTNIQTLVIDDDILLSQSVIFLVAGLEPLLSTLTMLLLELSQRHDILEKLRQEIDKIIDQNKEFSYQSLKEMEYLDLCIKETLRLYTPAEGTARHCVRSYTFPNGFTVEKGTDLFIPINKFHTDPHLFPQPLEFRPERFENYQGPSCAYLPFGQGPRICIAMRFAFLEMKMFISKLLYSYEICLDPKTKLPVQVDNRFFLRRHVTPVYMSFKNRTRK